MSAVAPLETPAELIGVLRTAVGVWDEELSVLDHGLQCAARLARWRPGDVELQMAGLVHDLGHVVRPDEPAEHAEVGSQLVGRLLGSRVADLVRLHVNAKRFLVALDPAYRDRLSEVSVRTLAAQGGPLQREDAVSFLSEPHWDDALVLRRADEVAKSPGGAVPPLDRWTLAIHRMARAAASNR